MVTETNTVLSPHTVMVEFHYAASTGAAMGDTGRLKIFTILALFSQEIAINIVFNVHDQRTAFQFW